MAARFSEVIHVGMGPADDVIPRQVHKGVNQLPGLGCS